MSMSTLASQSSAYACIVCVVLFALLLWVLISIGYWALKLARGGIECRRRRLSRAHSRLVIVCTKRGSRLWCFRLRQQSKRSWLESSVLIRLTRGIALMRTSRHSMHTMHNHWQSSLPLTPSPPLLSLCSSLWSGTWHSMLTSPHCFALD